ncbi:AMP-binding protein [Amycolatopsis thermophila]|uniref:Crotonobetaine/carnitine-CoA ligase n=1 Tax=Amycolatopsis thermophila TaxID=206084 RepID=A0ABU0F6I2_9PSEU|nr:AMP-binding protein [Amycolatopsis thermophila]MDQ0382731.1 crotonobetaine/carnitine-CoA ligase [Amycolatopsis thermophila]
MLEHQAAKIAGNEAIRFEDGERWTYEELVHQGYAAANVLAGRGVRRGQTVLVFLPNGPDWIRAWLGIAFLGAIVVPVNTAAKGKFLAHICQDSRAELIITDRNLATRLEQVDVRLQRLLGAELATGDRRAPSLDRPLEPWDPIYINYTSGTTGPSKGALTSNLCAAMTAHEPFNKYVRPTDCLLADLPMFHTSGQAPTFGFWSAGARVVRREVFSASRYLDIAREEGVTHSFLVGTMAGMLLAQPEKPDDADNPLRRILVTPMVGDPEGFMRRFGLENIFVCYGPTETGAVTILNDPTPNTKALGVPRAGLDVRVVDEHDIPVPDGTPGELIVRSDRPWELMTEYWGRPEATVKAWRNGWYHTGDAVVREPDGQLYFSDRITDSLRRRGENISSFEVESSGLSFPGVQEIACVSVPGDLDGDIEVKVYVVPQPGKTVAPDELVLHMARELPYFAVPRFVELVDELPKTPTAKIRKVELRERGNGPQTWDRVAAKIAINRTT